MYELAAPLDVLTIGLTQKALWAQQKAFVMLEDAKVSNSIKEKLITQLGNSKTNDLHVSLLPYLQHSSREVKMATLQALQNYNDISIAESIIKVYPAYLQENEQLKSLTFAILTSRIEWTKKLLSTINDNTVIKSNDVPSNVIQQLVASTDPSISKLAIQLWPERASRESKQKYDQVQLVQRVLKAGEGNRENGKQIFMLHCGSCHKLFNDGGSIGPDLTGYDRRNTTDFIMNTVDPNAEIREGYVMYQIDTNDGRHIVGKLIGQDGSTYTLQPLAGGPVTIQQAHIKNKTAQSISLMPEGLLDTMKDQEIRDLFAYITQLN
jgi:putative heme-binding domain-containing protein